MKFTRTQLLWIGIGIISFYYLLNKFEFILSSESSYGQVISEGNSRFASIATIQFIYQGQAYTFHGELNVDYEVGETLPVIFIPNNPEDAYVFGFLGFWYIGLLYCIVPLLFWCAFVLSAYQENDEIQVSFQKKKAEPKDSALAKRKQLD